MENKAIYGEAINFVNLFRTRQGKQNSKNKAKSRRLEVQLQPMYFGN